MIARFENARRRVLLTGSTGFVGRHIHRTLVARGHAVRTVVRRGREDHLHERADVVLVDDLFAQTRAWWADTCASIDTIIHAAWFVTPPLYLSSLENLACLEGSLALAQGAIDAEVDHLIGIGTCFEYAFAAAPLDVSAPLQPTTLYASTKTALYLVLQTLLAEPRTGFSWARLFYLYGEGEAAGRLVPYLRQRLALGEVADLSAGTQVRDFLDVARAADMIADLVSSRQLGAINVCSGSSTTIRHLAEKVADEYGRRDLLRFGTAPLRPTDPPVVVGVCNLDPPGTS